LNQRALRRETNEQKEKSSNYGNRGGSSAILGLILRDINQPAADYH
jgi:hypothetical protein